MSTRGSHGIGRFLASLVALLGVAIGVPAVLIAVSRARFDSANPLAGVDWPWSSSASDVGDTLSQSLDDDTVVDLLIRGSLCVIWVAAAVIVVTSVLEFVHMVRHRGIAMPTVRGFGWAQGAGRFIAVGVLVVVPMMSPKASIASAPAGAAAADDGRSPSAASSSASASASQSVPTPAATPAAVEHVVQPGESVYAIAEGLAGRDESRIIEFADAIVEANLGDPMRGGHRFTNPAYIEAGWVLMIPGHLVGTAPTTPTAERPGSDPGSEATIEPGSTTHTVREGDTLWDIADERLGDPTAWPEIWEENAGEDMGGDRTFDDPDLILEGWVLDLPASTHSSTPAPDAEIADVIPVDPAAGESPTSTTDAASDDESADEPTATASTDDREFDDEATTVTVEPQDDVAEVVPSDGPLISTDEMVPTTTEVSASTSSTTVPPAGASGAGGGHVDPPAEAPEAPSPLRLEHAGLLAAGILALVAVRRRQRLRAAMPRSRVPERREDVMATERRMRTVDAGERAQRVDVACRAAAFTLIDTDAQIGWIVASADGDVTLRLTEPADLPAPWEGTEQNWALPAEVPIELLSADARQVGMPCVALVQLGVTDDGDEVLVDLEACGTLAVEARPDQADEVVTAVAAGLASSLYAEVAHLITVSLPAEVLLGHRNAHRTGSVDAAFDLAASLVGSTLTNEQTSFALRSLRTGGEVWEPAVMLLRDDDRTAEHVDAQVLPASGHGLAVVAATHPGGIPDASARLVASAGGWKFKAFGASLLLCPIGLTSEDLDAVVDVLADAEGALEAIDELQWAQIPADGPVEPEFSPSSQEAPFEPTIHEIVVGLLGAVQVTDRSGAPGKFERSKTVELLAWLATHRDRSTRSGARTALWELDVRDATFANVVSEARRALGRLVPPPLGEEWLARTLTEQLPLHEAVVTDAQLVEERLDHARLQPPAQAMETLRPAVEMVREMPFTGSNYLWPDAEGITSNLVLTAITTTTEFAAHALSLGDTDAVFWATGQGLKVLPGHEELIALRMRAHARAGDLAGVRQEWESYERVIVADAWSDGEPAPKLLALRRELLTRSTTS